MENMTGRESQLSICKKIGRCCIAKAPKLSDRNSIDFAFILSSCAVDLNASLTLPFVIVERMSHLVASGGLQ